MKILLILLLFVVIFVAVVVIASLVYKVNSDDDADTKADKRMKTLIFIGWSILFCLFVIIFGMVWVNLKKIKHAVEKIEIELPKRKKS